VPGSLTEAADVNDAGQVTGRATDAAGRSEAFVTGPDGRDLRALGVLPGYTTSDGVAVNATGQVAGYVAGPGADPSVPIPRREAFLTGPNGEGMRGLGFLPGGSTSRAYAVNSAGQVVGVSSNATGRPEAFLTGPNGEGMRGLGVLPGYEYSEARAINSAGQVAGILADPNTALGVQEVFVTGAGSVGMVGIGANPAPNGRRTSVAEVGGIDESGRVVGTLLSSGGEFAFVYTPGVGLQYLSDVVGSGWNVVFGQGISATGGYVVAIADNPALGYGPGNRQQILIELGAAATVIPEPGTWALVGAGLLAVGGVRRRRRAAAP
jgi:probable HAF family extracellular repeat protein